jgi:hypothetical protein
MLRLDFQSAKVVQYRFCTLLEKSVEKIDVSIVVSESSEILKPYFTLVLAYIENLLLSWVSATKDADTNQEDLEDCLASFSSQS